MPPGPKPKPGNKRARRNTPTFETVELDAAAKITAPKLPPLGKGKRWAPGVVRWYAAFCASPMAAELLAFDWERVFLIARMRQELETNFSASMLAEIRQSEAKLGGTPDDRLRLRWKTADAKQSEDREQRAAAATPRRRRGDPRLQLVAGSGS